MRKIYVIDTNVLIQSPRAIHNFEDNEVLIPIAVVEELDSFKNADGEKGANARCAIRFLEKYRQMGELTAGVDLENGGILRVEKNFVDVKLPEDFPESKMDNRILKVCIGLKEKEAKRKVVLVTKDILLRIKAQILGIEADDYTTEQVAGEYSQYTGRCEVFVEEEAFNNFKRNGILPETIYRVDEKGNRQKVELTVNKFLILKADQSERKTLLGRFDGKKVVPLSYKKEKPYGVKPRSAGQYFLQEALMEKAEKAPLVIVKGMAGTAKTFYSLAVGLEMVMNCEKRKYRH